MDVPDLLIDPLRSGIDRRALLEVVLVGSACGALSFWVTRYRLAFPAESLSHGLLPGLVLAAVAGAPLLLGAGGGVAVAAVLVGLVARDERIGAGTATAIVVSGALGLGALLALSPEAPPRLDELLFGDPLGVTDTDLIAAGGLVLAGGGFLFLLHRPLCVVALDPEGAAALGIAVERVRMALLGMVAVAVAVAVQGLGSLLAFAVLVAPAVAVRAQSAGPARAILLAGFAAAVSGVLGIYASHHLGSAAGASVALALCAAAGAGALWDHLRRERAAAPRAGVPAGPPPPRSSPG